jgi:hypothetical protein
MLMHAPGQADPPGWGEGERGRAVRGRHPIVVTIPVPLPQHALARLEQVRILPQPVGVGHIKDIAGHLRSFQLRSSTMSGTRSRAVSL